MGLGEGAVLQPGGPFHVLILTWCKQGGGVDKYEAVAFVRTTSIDMPFDGMVDCGCHHDDGNGVCGIKGVGYNFL